MEKETVYLSGRKPIDLYSKENSGIHVIKIPYDSIESIQIRRHNDKKTHNVEEMYKAYKNDSDIIINGGLFNMATGNNVMSLICDGEEQNYKNGFYGLGTKEDTDINLLRFGQDGENWIDFVSAYPVLVKDGEPLEVFDNAFELNTSRHARQAIGVTYSGDVIICTVDANPGMYFEELAQLMYEFDAEYAIALDGGGSVYTMVDGTVINNPTEERKVNNVISIKLKENGSSILDEFADKDKIDVWAIDDVAFCVEKGIMQGDDKGLLHPKDNVTRQEMAQIVARIMRKE